MPLHINENRAPGAGNGGESLRRVARLTRRSFLAACTAGCAGIRRVDLPVDRPTAWALLSDTHIHESLKRKERGSNMADNLREAVAAVCSERFDAALFNGDMAFRVGTSADYSAFMPLVAPLQFRNIPQHFTLGNHDDRCRFLASIQATGSTPVNNRCVSQFMQDGLHWLFLDSLEHTNSVRGRLGASQIAWLARTLDAYPRIPAVLFLHHNPESTVVGFRVGLRDTVEFLETIRPRRQVKAVFFGHTHAFRAWSESDIHFVNLPALGYRFLPGVALGWVRGIFAPRGMSLRFCAVGSSHAAWKGERYFAFRPT